MSRMAKWCQCVAVGFIGAMTVSLGCQRADVETATPPLTASRIRAERRAYDGSPPVIPHQALGAVCTTCHTATGKAVPNMAYAPANPHGDMGSVENCRQCHLFKRSDDQFAETEFAALAGPSKKGERLFAGAPPTIPHSSLMRANCLACHAGPSARPEIRCTHPERTNCVQCHVSKTIETEFAAR